MGLRGFSLRVNGFGPLLLNMKGALGLCAFCVKVKKNASVKILDLGGEWILSGKCEPSGIHGLYEQRTKCQCQATLNPKLHKGFKDDKPQQC